MSSQFLSTFEELWTMLRAGWCQRHDLGGAWAFAHDDVKIDLLHRVVRVDVAEERVEVLIDAALSFFRQQQFDCAFTLSPRDRPLTLAARLEQRGFVRGKQASAMRYDLAASPDERDPRVQIEISDDSEYELWSELMCRSFDLPGELVQLGRSVLLVPAARRYLARIDGQPVGTTLLYSLLDMGYIDLVGTDPEYRRRGVASALVSQAAADSVALGNRWTALEVVTGSPAARLYRRLGFCTEYHRERFIKEWKP